MTKVNFAVPAELGGGMMTGNSMEEAVNGFLSRFDPEDVRAFAQGYAEYAERVHGVSLSRPTQRVAMVRPQTATVSAQKATAPSKPAPTVKHATVSARDAMWRQIVMGAGSDDPAAIDEFLQTAQGGELYTRHLAAVR